MKFIEKVALFTFFVMASWTACASPGACKNELRELVVPSFQDVAMNKSDIQAEIEDESNGIYSVRAYVAADSPDNLDKQVSIGWINLDTNSMKALDVTRDPDHPDELKVDEENTENFSPIAFVHHLKRCLCVMTTTIAPRRPPFAYYTQKAR